jgi:hypothetical protein
MHCSQHGIPLGSNKFLCSDHCCTQSLTNWKSEPLRLFNILNHCLPSILRSLTPPKDNPPAPSAFKSTHPKRNVMQNLHHVHKAKPAPCAQSKRAQTLCSHFSSMHANCIAAAAKQTHKLPVPQSVSSTVRPLRCTCNMHCCAQTKTAIAHDQPCPCITPVPMWRHT